MQDDNLDRLAGFRVDPPGRDDYAALRDIPFFDIFGSDEDLALIARKGTWLRVPAGTALVREGELEHDFFVLASGRAEAVKGGKHLARFGPGDIFGEMGALLFEKRTATVTAEEECLLFRLHIAALNKLSLATVFPILVHFYRTTARRLMAADATIAMT
ncbi:MAG: cyclic nucleotide-binding domain-containing protein [Thermodesulfobacteriota bacterium]